MTAKKARKPRPGKKVPEKTGFAIMVTNLAIAIANKDDKGQTLKSSAVRVHRPAKKERTKYVEEMYQLHRAERVKAKEMKEVKEEQCRLLLDAIGKI